MKKSIFVVLLLLGLVSPLFAQESDPLVDSFIRNFARASLQTKIQIIQDAGETRSPTDTLPRRVSSADCRPRTLYDFRAAAGGYGAR